MKYKPQITKVEAVGLCRSSKTAKNILQKKKYTARSIRVERIKKVALLKDGEIEHIIPRSAYIEFSQPEIEFKY